MKEIKVPQPVTQAVGRVKRDAPPLLIFAGIGGFVTTVYLAVKATPKALEIQKEFKEDTTLWEKTKALAPVYIPTFTVGVSSIACVLAGTTMYNRRLGALAAAYKITETAYKEYKDGVLDTIGEKKEKTVRDKIAEKKVNDLSDLDFTDEVEDKTLCIDLTTGGKFWSSKLEIERKINELNARLLLEGYLSVSEFREVLGNKEPFEYGDEIGWHSDFGLIDVSFSSQLAPSGRPCLTLSYDVMPGFNFNKMEC